MTYHSFIRVLATGVIALLCVLISGFCSAAPVADQDPAGLILNALNLSDSVSIANETTEKLSLIQKSGDELSKAKALTSQKKDSDSQTFSGYIDYWIAFEQAYADMVKGADAKMGAYQSLAGTDSDRYQKAYDGFNEAKKMYDSAKTGFENTLPLIRSIDPGISVLFPDGAIPKESVTNETIARLSDNIRICEGYSFLCQAEIQKIAADNNLTPEVTSALDEGKKIMQSLVNSSYVGEEAARFANITISGGPST